MPASQAIEANVVRAKTATRAVLGLAMLGLGACHVDAPGDAPSEASVSSSSSTAAPTPGSPSSAGLRLGDRGAAAAGGEGDKGNVVIGPSTVRGEGVIPMADATLATALVQVRFCYLRGAQMDPTMHGRVVLDLTVTSAGTVPEVGIVSKDGNLSEAVGRCLVRRMKSLSFTTEHGIGAVLRVPFDFISSYDGGVLPEAGGPLPTQMLVPPADDSAARAPRGPAAGAGQGSSSSSSPSPHSPPH